MEKEGLARLLSIEEQEIVQAIAFAQTVTPTIEERVKDAPEEAAVERFGYSSEIANKDYHEPIDTGGYFQPYHYEKSEEQENTYALTADAGWHEAQEIFQDELEQRAIAQAWNLSHFPGYKDAESRERAENYSRVIGSLSFVLYDITRTRRS